MPDNETDLPIYAIMHEKCGFGPVHEQVLNKIGEGKKVLDVGCSTGYFAKEIKQKLGGIVDGVEPDRRAFELAKKNTRTLYEGSIDDPGLLSKIKDKYDAVLFLDVLEHLTDPKAVLISIQRILAEKGAVIASVPNIANWRIRLSLLFGRFDYTDVGILDRTHLRFFTIKTVKDMFNEAGYEIEDIGFTLGISNAVTKSVPGAARNVIRDKVKKLFRYFPGLFANQFIIKAVVRK